MIHVIRIRRCPPNNSSNPGNAHCLRPSPRRLYLPIPTCAVARRSRRQCSILQASATPKDNGPQFDWNLGLALAGCSFEAYNEMAPDDKCLKQISATGTETVYVDTAFLQSKLAGVLAVTVKSASNLPAGDWFPARSSDPYARLSLGTSGIARTSTIDKTLNPTWNETLYLFVKDRTEKLTVRVLDADVGDSDDLLGVASRPVADLLDGAVHELSLDLKTMSGGKGGTVELSVAFLSFKDQQVLQDAAGSSSSPNFAASLPRAITESEWRAVAAQLIPAEAAADALFDPVAYMDNPESDTQIWVFWNPELRKLVLAFRGTEQAKFKDVLTDLSLVPASLDPEGVNEGPSAADVFEPALKALKALQKGFQQKEPDFRSTLTAAIQAAAEQSSTDLWVHSGFLKAYQSVERDVFAFLDTVLANESEQWTIYVVGHSLGGALSTLCTFDLAKRRSWKTAKRPNLQNVSFGSPRVGNKVFAKEFDTLLPDACWRVVNKQDAVALVPRLLGYSHVGHKVTLSADGIEVELNSAQGLAEGTAFQEVAATIVTNVITGDVAQVAGAVNTAAAVTAEEVQKILDSETAAFETIMDGSAVEEHLEPLYLENLKLALKTYKDTVG